jgi:hypothetical protein
MPERMRASDYADAFASWPPTFGPENPRFGYKQLFVTIQDEGEPVSVPLTGLHKNGWWVGVRVVAANKQRTYEGVELSAQIDNEEWSLTSGEWSQMEPVSWNETAILQLQSEGLPASTTLAVRLCFYYTK